MFDGGIGQRLVCMIGVMLERLLLLMKSSSVVGVFNGSLYGTFADFDEVIVQCFVCLMGVPDSAMEQS